MIKGGGKGVLRRGGGGKGEVWIWGQDAIFGILNGRRSRPRSVAKWAAEPGVEASKNCGEIVRTYAAMRTVAPTGCGGALGRFS
jgi:hypothetical protein